MGEESRPRLQFRSGRKFACWQNGMKTIEPIQLALIRFAKGGELFRRGRWSSATKEALAVACRSAQRRGLAEVEGNSSKMAGTENRFG
jgi:hypothetical protein